MLLVCIGGDLHKVQCIYLLILSTLGWLKYKRLASNNVVLIYRHSQLIKTFD